MTKCKLNERTDKVTNENSSKKYSKKMCTASIKKSIGRFETFRLRTSIHAIGTTDLLGKFPELLVRM